MDAGGHRRLRGRPQPCAAHGALGALFLGLSVLDFLKRTTLAQMSPAALRAIGPAAEVLARSESLQAHGLSVTARLRKLNG